MKRKNIIIGGGMDGMYLAYRLCQRGEDVTVLEKNNEIGGLIAGFDICGNRLEKTYHHLFKTDKLATDLIEELGLSNDLGWHESSMAMYYGGKLYPFSGAIDLLKFEPISLIDRIRTGIVSLYISKTKNWQKFEKIAAYVYMRKLFGDNSYKVIWQPLLKSKFGDKYKKVSMAWMWARLNSRGGSKEDGVEKLGCMMGGFGKITDKLAKEVKKMDGKVLTGVEVKKIDKDSNKIKVVTSKKTIIADKVFACIDNLSLSKLLDLKKYEKYINKLKKIDYLGAINLVFGTKQDLTDYYWNNINDTNSPFVAFVKHTQLIGKKNYSGNNIYYLGTYIDKNNDLYEKSDRYIKKVYFDYLNKIVPSFDKEKVKESYVFKYPKAQHVVVRNYERVIPKTETVIDNLFLLNYSQIYPKDRGINWSIQQVDKLLNKTD